MGGRHDGNKGDQHPDSGGGDSDSASTSNKAQDAAASDRADEEPTLVGVWERRIRNDAGPDPLIAMEIRGDGTYSVNSEVAYLNDRGRYSVDGGLLMFSSEVKQRNSRQAAYSFKKNGALVLDISSPFPERQEWSRRKVAPMFETTAFEGRRLPKGLPKLAPLALHGVSRPWREDALPVWLEVEEMQPKDYSVIFYFVSPRDGAGLRLAVGPFAEHVTWGDKAYPPQFFDLPPLTSQYRMMKAARASGMTGALRSAELRVWKSSGPTWRLSPHGPAGRQYSAITGARIRGDVSSYVADYNKQWNEALTAIGEMADAAAAFLGPWGGSLGDMTELEKADMQSCNMRGGQYSIGQRKCNF